LLTIEVLGTGCPKCTKLTQNVQEAIDSLNLECTFKKITEIDEILTYGIMITPGLVVNGEVKSSGKVLSPAEITSILEGV